VRIEADEAVVSVTGIDSGLGVGVEAFLQACESRWPAGQARPLVVTRAPGRLDCMGGMADFSGALALQMPIEQAVYVAAGRRQDQRLEIHSPGWNGGGPASHSWPLSVFYRPDGRLIAPQHLAGTFGECPWARYVAGVCLALLESGEIPHFAGGVTLVMQSDIPAGAGLASSAALQVAVVKALAALLKAEIGVQAILKACRSAGAAVAGTPDGLVDHITCLLGAPGALLQIRGHGDDAIGVLALPKDVTFAAVDVGMRLPIYAQRYQDNRVSCFMGQYLVERLLGRSKDNGEPGPGCLASISPSEYVERLRNDLPVKVRGRDFLAAWGRPPSLEGLIQPDQIYKVRSRTEHHIYENDRTHRLMERLSRARRTGERDALVEAGELMYASHWSYGQRCGMGSIETDVLVNCIRARGAARGLYGAKVTAGGCGGAVAVLMSNNPAARVALEEACSVYAQKTGKKPAILIGSSQGAAGFGHRYLD
jgi:galactokinase